MTAQRRLILDWVWPLVVFGALAFVPELNVSIPKLFDQPISSPGTLALLSACVLYGGLALTYDLQFGFTGLLSFGHALYVAVGAYLANIAITDWHWSFWPSIFFTVGVAFVLANVLGFVSLRVGGIAFAMVTLAFAQAGAVLALKDPHHWTHGEEGLGNEVAVADSVEGVVEDARESKQGARKNHRSFLHENSSITEGIISSRDP